MPLFATAHLLIEIDIPLENGTAAAPPRYRGGVQFPCSRPTPVGFTEIAKSSYILRRRIRCNPTSIPTPLSSIAHVPGSGTAVNSSTATSPPAPVKAVEVAL